MSRPPEPNCREPFADTLAGLQWVCFLLRCLAYPHELLVRRFGTMGRGYRSRPESVIGVLLVPLFLSLLIPPHWGVSWLLLHSFYLFMVAGIHNWTPVRGGHLHRLYIGDPLVGSAETRWGETWLGLGLGLALLVLCPTVGGCQLLATVCSRVNLFLLKAREQRIVDSMRDGQIDAQYYAELLRRGK